MVTTLYKAEIVHRVFIKLPLVRASGSDLPTGRKTAPAFHT
jgi:hypothetical protein